MRHAERGQVLPLWIFGAITTFALMFLAINYAQAVRYQIRAQNAADSAANAIASIQAQRFNMVNIALYNANIEEYRLRRTLDGLIDATAFTGGCDPNLDSIYPIDIKTGTAAAGSCDAVYQNLRFFYLKSENRYTADVLALNNAASGLGFTNHIQPDAQDFIKQIGAGSPACAGGTPVNANAVGDCQMKYAIVSIQERTGGSGLQAVEENVANLLIPGLGYYSSNYGPNTENPDLWAPIQVDVTACKIVPPLIPNFGPIHLPNSYAIGRAAATNVMVEEDWLDPGRITDPVRGSPGSPEMFQDVETYTTTSAVASGNSAATYDWYGVDFGGNDAYAFPSQGFFGSGPLSNDELSARVGWWNSIPIRPFETTAPTLTAASQCN